MGSDGALRVWEDPRPGEIGATAEEMLEALGGPVLLRVGGRDRRRSRVVVTLLHGNEPSGLRAVHSWLRSRPRPQVDAICIVAAVAAARRPPVFSHRMLPGGADLNRCFRPPFAGGEGALAAAILDAIAAARPEALIDLHNNTGNNPPYAIATRLDAARFALTALFAERLVHSDLHLGALMEAVADQVPSVTIECGRVGDPRADAVARRGIERFFSAAGLDLARGAVPPPAILEAPVPVRVRPGVRVAVGARADAVADLTIAADLDRHNFETVAAGTAIGWTRDCKGLPVTAIDASGRDQAGDLFALVAGEVRVRRDCIPIMMTTDPKIAAQDCLFYVVRRPAP